MRILFLAEVAPLVLTLLPIASTATLVRPGNVQLSTPGRLETTQTVFEFKPVNISDITLTCNRSRPEDDYQVEIRFNWLDLNLPSAHGACTMKLVWNGTDEPRNPSLDVMNPRTLFVTCQRTEFMAFKVCIVDFPRPTNFSFQVVHFDDFGPDVGRESFRTTYSIGIATPTKIDDEQSSPENQLQYRSPDIVQAIFTGMSAM